VLELAGIRVDAVSVGGFETCIRLPGWKLAFDIGRAPPAATACGRILFTHSHIDHMGGVLHHCAQRDMLGRSAPEYWMPAEVAEHFEEAMAAWRRLAHSNLPCTVRAVSPGDKIPLGKNRWVEVFRVVHRVPSVGYALCQRKHKLRDAYQGLPGPEIGRLRAEGIEITRPVETVEVAFCGDTTIDVVDREAAVRDARLLLLETTFLDDRVTLEHVRKSGHVHIDELVARIPKLNNEVVLCTHVSRRHHGQMRELFAERIPEKERGRFVLLEPEAPWI
jgi:ribonuclease Z